MFQKQLEVCLQQDNIEQLMTALPLCVALSDEKFKPWYYQNYLEIYSISSNYIDIIYNDNLNYTNKEFSPLEIKTVPYQFLSQDIIPLVKEYIQKEYYLIIFVDEFYMRDSAVYQKYHFNHEYLIYGCDESKGILFGIGFLDHKFSKIPLLLDDFTKAFQSAKNQPHRNDFPADHEIHIIRKRKYKQSFPFQIQEFKKKISNYLSSTLDPTAVYIKSIDDYPYHLGMSVYHGLKEHMDFYCEGIHNNSYNSIHAFYEHKKSILTRLQYINQRYSYHLETAISEYQAHVIAQMNQIRLLYIKLNQDTESKDAVCAKLKTKLNLCKEKEYEILSHLLLHIN